MLEADEGHKLWGGKRGWNAQEVASFIYSTSILRLFAANTSLRPIEINSQDQQAIQHRDRDLVKEFSSKVGVHVSLWSVNTPVPRGKVVLKVAIKIDTMNRWMSDFIVQFPGSAGIWSSLPGVGKPEFQIHRALPDWLGRKEFTLADAWETSGKHLATNTRIQGCRNGINGE
ncbi:uncharacterized protein CIMG_13081 [Coccidioides immitis RS]|uniref:Uncharacterized protein n=1 Tax=Coccidioides immitis (strain RS) TaxID=246410 RepID=A0A0D8JUL9_COCIM|nr:uncharacterized protein CIMG_13081 [Coccidioides immitis RS]KJF60621.1 hypothetical protein CIMG_13081 [Coccidioides immitis RS]